MIPLLVVIILIIYIWLTWKRLQEWWSEPEDIDDYGLAGDLARFIRYSSPGEFFHIGTIYNSDYYDEDE